MTPSGITSDDTVLFREAFQQASDAMVVLDSKGRVVAANSGAERLLGLPAGGAAGWVMGGLFPAGWRDRGAFEAVIADGEGTRLEVEVSASPLDIANRSLALAVLRDVTRRNRVERDQRRLNLLVTEAKREWEETFDSIDDGIFLLDRQSTIVRVNRAVSTRSGLPFREIVGRRLDQVIGAEAETAVRSRLTDEKGTGAVEEALEIPLWNGVYDVTVWPRTDPGGRRRGHIVVLADVTERQRLREQLIHSEKLSALGELISGIAHELNNPLTGVLGYAQILSLKDGEGRFGRELSHLREESLRASRIVRNLLTFARRHEARREPEDLNEVVRRTVALREYDLRVRNIEVTLDLAPGLVRSMMDRVQLQQVVLNLLNNGEHAIHGVREGGRIRVATGMRDGRLILAVEDNGPGVPAHIVGRIFNPFFTTKPVGKGTGLGLAICFGIARDHGGTIRLDPDFAGGARFVVELPVEPWRPTVTPEAEAADRAPVATATQKVLEILFVDDEEAIRSLGGEYLGSLGHRVVLAKDGDEALDILRARDFDVVLSDLKMPSVSGSELFARATGEKPAYRDRFAFITGDVGVMDRRAAEMIAESPLVSKPFDLDELDRVVRRVADGA